MFNLIKFSIYKIIPSWLYYQISFFVKKRRLKKANKIYFNKNNSILIFDILKKRNNEKVFILGSGSSINDLTNENFKEIKRNCSIGINKWIFHKFISDYYMIELTDDDIRNNSIRLRILSILKNKLKTPIFLIYSLGTNSVNMKKWIKDMDPDRVFLYEFLRPDIFKNKIKSEFINLLNFLSKKNKKSNIITLGLGGSIVRAISLSLLIGFSKIIILGVDLKNTKYFWDTKKTGLKNIKSGQKNYGKHLTAKKRFGGIPVQRSIIILDKIARQFYNSCILISTNKSLLSSKLKKYKWQKK